MVEPDWMQGDQPHNAFEYEFDEFDDYTDEEEEFDGRH